MRRRNSNWWVWLILFFVFSGGMSFMLPLFLIIAVVVGIAIASEIVSQFLQWIDLLPSAANVAG